MAETKTKPTVSGKLAEKQETSSHVAIKPLYTPADLEGWNYDEQLGYPGTVSVHARRAGLDVSRPPVDHAAVRRHGRRRRVEPPLQVSAEPGHHRAEHCVRFADADRTRLRQPAGHGRSRQGRRGHRFHRRHDAAVRRHQPGEDLHLDDHQRDGVDPAGAVHRRGAAHRARRARSCRAPSRTTC